MTKPSNAGTCPMCEGSGEYWANSQGMTLGRCGRCSTYYQSPPPTPEQLALIYQQDYYDSWGMGESHHHVEEMKRRTFGRQLALLEQHIAKGRILDVGCATGFLLAEAQQRGWSPYGIELNPYGAKEANGRFPGCVHQGTLEDFPPPTSAFDAITLFDLFEHLTQPGLAVQRMHNLLREDGLVLLSVPDAESLTCRWLGTHWPHFKPEHIFYPTVRGLCLHFESRGFRLVSSQSAKKTFTVGYLASQLARHAHPLISRAARMVQACPRLLLDRALTIPSGQVTALFMKCDRP